MKDSKEYSGKIRKLFRSLKREHGKVTSPEYKDPLEALVYAIISEHADLSSSKSIVKRMKGYFVDLNDLRVSRTEEILEILESSVEHPKKTATTLRQVLNSVFNKYDTVSLKVLTETGKRQAKKVLDKFEGASRFSIDYCFMSALGGHSIPLTEKMLNYLKTNELVHPESTFEEITGFLDRQITVSNAYTFYSLLRLESEAGTREQSTEGAGKKKKTTKRTKRKTKKKDSTKRRTT